MTIQGYPMLLSKDLSLWQFREIRCSLSRRVCRHNNSGISDATLKGFVAITIEGYKMLLSKGSSQLQFREIRCYSQRVYYKDTSGISDATLKGFIAMKGFFYNCNLIMSGASLKGFVAIPVPGYKMQLLNGLNNDNSGISYVTVNVVFQWYLGIIDATLKGFITMGI